MQEAKYRLLHQQDIDAHDNLTKRFFEKEGVKVIKFEKIVDGNYFAVQFFDDKNNFLLGPARSYRMYYNNKVTNHKSIFKFNQEVKSKYSFLYQEVKDNVLLIYGKKAPFVKAIEYLLLHPEPILPDELTMIVQYLIV